MHTLFPPLAETGDDDDRSSASSSVLSAELRANFDAMRAIVRAQRRLDQQPHSADSQQDVASDTTDTASKKRKAPQNEHVETDDVVVVVDRNHEDNDNDDNHKRELQKQKFDLAVATAISVEGEISRLANGIAELEALLRSQEEDTAAVAAHGAQQQQQQQHMMPGAAFPFLPLVVPLDDEYEHHTKDAAAQKDACCVDNTLAGDGQDITQPPISHTRDKQL